MVFGLPALLGFLPLLVYIILSFRGHDVLKVVLYCIALGAILTGQTPIEISDAIAEGLGSFLGLIGFIILLGAGLGELLKRSKVAQNIVYQVFKNETVVKSQRRAILATMFSVTVLSMLLGSFTGPCAILAPIVIPILGRLKVTPNTLGVVYHGAGAAGLFIGPFVPPVVTTIGLTGISYGTYMINVGLPIASIALISTYFMAMRTQKRTEDKFSFDKEDIVQTDSFKPDDKVKKATTFFFVSISLLLAYGVYVQAGASYTIFIMLIVTFITGYSANFKIDEIIDSIIEGSKSQYWLFFLFVLYQPFLNFIVQSGAYDALAALIKPLIESGGEAFLMIFTTLFGIFGVSGAAVAQEIVMNDIFTPLVEAFNFPMHLWALVLLVGSQITFFAYPTGDMIGQMGLARSKDLKSMIKNGWAITVLTVLFIVIRAFTYNF